MTRTQKVVNVKQRNGETTEYVRYSVRLNAFLEKYPVTDGWARTTEPVDPQVIAPQFAAQYAVYAAQQVEHGVSPPILCAFKATLLNPDGRVVQTAHAAGIAASFKDIGCIETAAQQRLIASVGFGSDTFDLDEDENASSLEMSSVTPKAKEPEAAKAPSAPPVATSASTEAPKADNVPATPPVVTAPAAPTATVTEAAANQPAPPETPKKDPKDAPVPASMARQIQIRCKSLGIEMPSLKSLAEARQFQASLTRRGNQATVQ